MENMRNTFSSLSCFVVSETTVPVLVDFVSRNEAHA